MLHSVVFLIRTNDRFITRGFAVHFTKGNLINNMCTFEGLVPYGGNVRDRDNWNYCFSEIEDEKRKKKKRKTALFILMASNMYKQQTIVKERKK